MKISQEDLDTQMENAEVRYWTPEGTTSTVCIVTLENGYDLLGHSACVDPAEFDEELGRKLALEHARRSLWPLMGYTLAEIRFLELKNLPAPWTT